MICYMTGLPLNIPVPPLHVSACSFTFFLFSISQKIKYSLSERFFFLFCFVCFVVFFNLLTTDVFTLSVGACQSHISLAILRWMEQRDVTDDSGTWNPAALSSVWCCSLGWGGTKYENFSSA